MNDIFDDDDVQGFSFNSNHYNAPKCDIDELRGYNDCKNGVKHTDQGESHE